MKLYNTLTGKKEEFIPFKQDEVRMYTCGPTVYNFFHIGNSRPFILFDVLRRYLEYKGYKVTYVQNFTDIDDKMIKRAEKENTTVKEIADKYINEYFKDADALGIKRATIHPKATDHINDIIRFVKKLVDKGIAYEIEGDVYYDTASFKEYGKLSGQKLEDLELGARIRVDERKRNPVDFALWKAQKPGEPAWDSPWGKGRPGWHIECSVMASKYLGDTIDIHAGGQDLIFPHHENEIAQSEGLTGKTFARFWLHNAYLNIDNKKMSKSLDNFFTARDILNEFDGEVVRLFMLSAHYRNPFNFSRDLLMQAKSALDRLYNAKNNIEHLKKHAKKNHTNENENELIKRLDGYREKFEQAMDDDFNTADAIAVIFDLVKDINTSSKMALSLQSLIKAEDIFNELTKVVGLVNKKDTDVIDSEIEALIEKRQEARKDKNWAVADSIRDELKDKGIILEDTPEGVKWHKG